MQNDIICIETMSDGILGLAATSWRGDILRAPQRCRNTASCDAVQPLIRSWCSGLLD